MQKFVTNSPEFERLDPFETRADDTRVVLLLGLVVGGAGDAIAGEAGVYFFKSERRS